ncbi:DUF3667 domain-containing protein [Rothia nasimurium]|uniref:DUF3667 domain-containing protein n=1 Tax=Luteibacter anthropi TaxID=564369 RepID=A0A7X5UCX2_9GAMM|nr:DUF3667 domain-containing protein [Luteibacter anthropi]NII08189.1 DUF3667 domain-containing protein [Luteibacter anthropi]
MKELEPAPVLMCANCSAALQGEFCHHCGQSIHSVLRPMSHMLEDAGDIFFHMDERIVHTVPPLFTRPGFLTLEYFSGRRVRYIAPFRLMFVFCLMAFFFVHVAVNGVHFGGHEKDAPKDTLGAFAAANTAEEVQDLYDAQIRDLRHTEADPAVPGLAKAGLATARGLVRDTANTRLNELGAPPLAPDQDDVPAQAKPGQPKMTLGWTSESVLLDDSTKVSIGWLPDAVNQRLTASLVRLRNNIREARHPGPQRDEAIHRIVEGLFGVLPLTMFVMVPVFALLLKVFYLFRRRLYMEHLIVALHSHAFLFLALLVLMLLGFARTAIAPHVGAAAVAIGTVQWAIAIWMPVYLLLMQKRVYRQGWPMTIFKYWLIGSVYFWLLLFALVIAMLIGLTH